MPDETISRRDFGKAMGIGALTSALPGLADPASAQSSAASRPGSLDELCDLSATELVNRMRRKDVSAREVMSAHLARIERVNSKVNAIVTLVAERAMADAAKADAFVAAGGKPGLLHGLPVAHKDLVDTAGIRTTLGSMFYKDNVPSRDAPIVTRIRAAGAITLGKTNTPELGAGSQTFNQVFGATRNPYDLTRTCGGSSGGAAVALACGMVPLADGSDTGGSLRNPAAFCNVVGLRPSPGRVASGATSWNPLSVSGPMARTVSDVALFLSVIGGYDASYPLSLTEDPAQFRVEPDARRTKPRIAWWKGLGGIPFEPEIRRVVDGNRQVFEGIGVVTDDEPDFTGVDEAFQTLRYAANHPRYSALVRERPEWVKDTIKYEVAEAEKLTGADVGRALARQARMYDQSRQFFERYDFFVLPVTQVAPFDVTVPYPTSITGAPMANYVDWMRSCWYITLMSNPAISVPGGFTSTGLPVGIQIVGRHRSEWSLIQIARSFEAATQYGKKRPGVVSV